MLAIDNFQQVNLPIMFQLFSVNSDKGGPPWTSSHLLSKAKLCKQWAIISYLWTSLLGITSGLITAANACCAVHPHILPTYQDVHYLLHRASFVIALQNGGITYHRTYSPVQCRISQHCFITIY